jgi:prophage DNA circulation protein
MMRDWAKTLLPASYNGVGFQVDTDDLGGGRRLAIHQTAGGEVPVIEDMGRATSTFNVTAYLVGDNADGQANALIAMAGLPGPASWCCRSTGRKWCMPTRTAFAARVPRTATAISPST